MEIVEQPQPAKRKRKINWKAVAKRRKLMILAGMFVLLVVTGYLNFSLNSSSPVGGGGGGAATQRCEFEFFRTDRENTRNVQLAILNSTIANSDDPAEVTQSQQKRSQILREMSFETSAEGLIRAKQLFDDVAVSKNGGNVSVVIRNPRQLTETESELVQIVLHDVAQEQLPVRSMSIAVVP